jgi:ADP-ribosyl-[dinitrogen reductase] hydrolase
MSKHGKRAALNKGTADRIRGALYGVACGDALGAPLEFLNAESIWQQHGYVREMIGGGWLNVKPGEVTDDTQMTVAVARGIVEQPHDPIPAIGRHFVEWYASRPKDVGATCSSAISKAVSSASDKEAPTAGDWIDAALWTDQIMGGKSAGNGSLMRTAYIGLYCVDENDAYNIAGAISKMTPLRPNRRGRLPSIQPHVAANGPWNPQSKSGSGSSGKFSGHPALRRAVRH